MVNTDLIKILSIFTKEELSGFEKFIQSPYFNKQSTLIRLFNAIKNLHPEFNSNFLDNKTIFNAVNPGKKYNSVLFRKYMSELTKLAEEFLTINSFRNNDEAIVLTLLIEHYKRNLPGRFSKSLNKIKKSWNKDMILDQDGHLVKHLILEVEINQSIINSNTQPYQELLFSSQFHMLNYIFQLTADNTAELRNSMASEEFINSNNIVSTLLRNFDLENFIKELENKYEPIELLGIKLNYYAVKLLLDNNDDEVYCRYKEIIKKYSKDMPANLFYLNITKLLNHCIYKINEGNKIFVREFCENYRFAINIPSYYNKISKNITYGEYRNALYYCMEFCEPEWLKWYSGNFLNSISNDKRNNAKAITTAWLNFEEKNYDAVLEHIRKTGNKDQQMKIDTDLLISKTYYELDYLDSCYLIIDSFTNLIQNNKHIKPNQKEQYFKFIRYYRQLTDLKKGNNKHTPELMLRELEKDNIVIGNKWLTEKVKELIS